jgi:type 1 fimbria pilin
MKKLLHTSIAGVLIGCAFPAFAASTVDLAVKGLIVPSACTPTLSANTVDVGRVSVKDLNQDSRTFLTPTTLTLSVNCEASTLFAMKATDNRSDSAAAINELGIGKTAAGELIGGYWLMLSNATADTTAVQMIGSTNNGGSWFRFREDDAWGTTYLLSIAAVGAGSVPIPARDTQVALSVNPFIFPAKDVTIGEDTLIDGSATIEVKYL